VGSTAAAHPVRIHIDDAGRRSDHRGDDLYRPCRRDVAEAMGDPGCITLTRISGALKRSLKSGIFSTAFERSKKAR
jgi:hypothetical protein